LGGGCSSVREETEGVVDRTLSFRKRRGQAWKKKGEKTKTSNPLLRGKKDLKRVFLLFLPSALQEKGVYRGKNTTSSKGDSKQRGEGLRDVVVVTTRKKRREAEPRGGGEGLPLLIQRPGERRAAGCLGGRGRGKKLTTSCFTLWKERRTDTGGRGKKRRLFSFHT